MGNDFSVAHDVAQIGDQLVARHHSHLREARILYAFTEKEPKKNGKLLMGKAQILNDLQRFLIDVGGGGDYELLITITEAVWLTLTPQQRCALIDHELCHFEPAARGDGWQIRPHDVEEFAEIVSRHGLWDLDLKQFGAAMHQLALPSMAS